MNDFDIGLSSYSNYIGNNYYASFWVSFNPKLHFNTNSNYFVQVGKNFLLNFGMNHFYLSLAKVSLSS